jgi:hypothetical protein
MKIFSSKPFAIVYSQFNVPWELHLPAAETKTA